MLALWFGFLKPTGYSSTQNLPSLTQINVTIYRTGPRFAKKN